MDTLGHLVKRLSALHRNLIRKFALDEGLQPVHVEILHYLSLCNRYSNTTQALSEYLGQTKGSISQSLGFLEGHQFLKKHQDKKDERIFHLVLNEKGLSVVKNLNQALSFKMEGNDHEKTFKNILTNLQKDHQMRSFGICLTCRFNENPGKDKFRCGLTGETLSEIDVQKICREHELKA